MKLTLEQKTAINYSGHVILVACPGSGKTRAIIAKLLRCVDAVRDTPRRVACITYTNAAVYEIEHRVRMFGSTGDEELCDVSTIHAFCLNNILRHYYWKSEDYKDGFLVCPSDSEEYLQVVEYISDKYNIDSYPKQMFDSLNRKPNGEPITPSGISNAAAIEFWEELRKRGFIDFCNIVYYSYCLLRDEPSLRANVAARFATILIDEFQDTSRLQVEILSLLSNEGVSELFMVGDPEQSIYSFAGAERNLMLQFAKSVGAKQFSLSGNFRSSTPIIQCAETLIPRKPKMFAAGVASKFNESPSYEHFSTNFTAITEGFLPLIDALGIALGDAAILSPTWYELLPLARELREYGIPIVGPGARPYKKRHLFASLAEQVCAYIEEQDPSMIASAERELFFLLQNVTGKANFHIFTFNGRRVLFRLLSEGKMLRDKYEGAEDWLIAVSQRYADILHTEGLMPQESIPMLRESAKAMLLDMKDKKIDVANLTLNDLGIFANPVRNLKLLTMHGAKGREFGAVAIIAALDGMVPYHNYFNELTVDGLEESRRLFYVSITRAKRLLMIFTRDDKRTPSRFISELGLIN